MDHYRSSQQDEHGIGVIPVSMGNNFHNNPPPPPPSNPIRVSAFSKPCSSSTSLHHHHEYTSPTTAADHLHHHPLPLQDHPNPILASISPSSAAAGLSSNSKAAAAATKYRECLRNHAASVGGHVLDGCCEFMPSSTDPLKCAACDCHRSFHRRQPDGDPASHYSSRRDRLSVPLLLPPPPPPPQPMPLHHLSHQPQKQQQFAPPAAFPPSPSGVIHGSSPAVAYGGNNSGSGATTESSSEERLDAGPCATLQQNMAVSSKKRFRTKFTPEQKEQMLSFAERAGWRIQRQDDASVENLCREIGVRRQVLKVWMHNNKHSLRKQQQQQPQQGAGAGSESARASQPPAPPIFGHVTN